MNYSVKLVVVFNHRFDKNIPVLEKYYGSNFSDVKFLVPFYDGDNSSVIGVTSNTSFNFSSYFFNGFDSYYDENTDYYLFLADDALLNPAYNETNIVQHLNMEGKAAYLTYFSKINCDNGITWFHSAWTNYPFKYPSKNMYDFVPPYESMLEKMNDFFGSYDTTVSESFLENSSDGDLLYIENRKKIFEDTMRPDKKIYYPLAYGWSDIVMIHKSVIKDFVRLCGIFGAVRMFAEVAVPTAIIYTCPKDRVVTAVDCEGMFQTVLWGEKRNEIIRQNDADLNKLASSFKENELLIHPIKLSQWKTEEYMKNEEN